MKRRKGLGRGLNALLESGPETPAVSSDAAVSRPEVITELPLDSLEPNRFQPRSQFESTGLENLAESIKSQGVVQPIVVTPKDLDSGKDSGPGKAKIYTIIAGERRWRASRMAELETVPVVVREVTSDQQLLEMALVENIQRADLNSIEEAEAYRTLGESFELSQEEVASRVGKGRTTITNALRLLRLPEEIQDLIRDGRLTAGQARPLLTMADKAAQIELAERAIKEGLSARDLEALTSEPKKETEKPEKGKETDVHTRAAMEKLTQNLQTRVDIVRKRRGGQVRIFFHSEEELMRLYDFLIQGNE